MQFRIDQVVVICLVLFASAEADDIGFSDGTQLNLRNCRQSSDYDGKSRCTGAIDGTTSGAWSWTGASTTNSDAEPWWETQTEQVTQFKKVRIYNRQDCCPERLNNFVIKVDGEVCAEYHSDTAFAVKTFNCDKRGRVLRIQSRISIHLTLHEVQAFGFEHGPHIVAPQLTLSSCHQSSDLDGKSRCTGAIDGNTAQSFSYDAMSNTEQSAKPWWEAKTEVPSKIMQVRIFNRQDCCPERLGNFIILVDEEVCAEYNSPAPFSVWTFDCNRIGSSVRIESRVATVLSLAEVQVFGEKSTGQAESAAHQLHLRNCRQSSDLEGKSRCTGAIDGTTSGSWSWTGVATTNNDAQPWWETQTEQVTQFKKVRIYNRQDCCPERLNNFVIKVDGTVCAEYKSDTAFAVKTFDCNREGRVLRIESRIQTYLTLHEVQVFGFYKDSVKPSSQLRLSNCRQSSDYAGRSRCNGAIDGNTAQIFSFETMSTTEQDAVPWWEARTDVSSRITQVRIYNRQDCCPERLGNFVIKVDNVVCAEYNSQAPFSVWTFDCNKIGSVLRIESRVATYLTMAEVQAFGKPAAKECYKKQQEFVGSSTVTATGKPCQSWSVKSCPDGTQGVSCHVPNVRIGEAILTGSNCRNPLVHMRDRPWCYTTTPTRWEFCDVPEC